ncbi:MULTISPECIES: efflux RND transporter periplasmic adaptor subunit [Dyadobacter]|uniref:Efflux RND transporter periplasmic adaptor subunit n=1 Tax=Dyadobacter chenhuakuii TaxID=2909339 RepID=A0ABY4XL13_9BACT|nr:MULTISPECIES: efflux RND transporter periplasmic adaptor subunit [Dyadobacter]MCF2493601.1 efflux RND transporter periplasmic adaptor subunit [Dyadobacter chenhuakuii]MCF2517848.1 efflux RND transporter periplasmic adaptor subunit [Dyadobacter sp. CY351]USJ30738.1 efflux RND transporter periplasmic adaptor subunit [Dyadobacter chenhuakuii]
MARKSSKRIWWITAGIVALLVAGLFGAKQAGYIGKPKATEVEYTNVKKTDIIERVSASGKVQPEVEVKLSPDVSGEIISLNVAEGDSVVKGQLLLKIRPDNYESLMARAQAAVNSSKANYEQTKAMVSQAEARLLQAKANFDRNKKLYNDKVISAADYEQFASTFGVAQQDVESAKANVSAALYNIKSAEASLKDAAENLRKTSIFAPVTGVVSLLNVEAGERVVGTSQMAGTEMMRIANLSNMEVRVNVNENDIVRVALGDTAEIDVDAYSASGRKFRGIVKEIANTAAGLASAASTGSAVSSASADAVTEFEVKVKILNESFADLMVSKSKKSYPFKPGMTASVEIITERKNGVVSVPIAAVTTRNSTPPVAAGARPGEQTEQAPEEDEKKPKKEEAIKEVVFVDVNGKAEMKEVKTGISDFENIEILSGLKPGDTIISGPYIAVSKNLKNGDLVEKKKEEVKKDDKKSNENAN